MTNKLALPISIIIAGALIAGAVFMTKSGSGTTPKNNDEVSAKDLNIPAPNEKDHILGSPNAKIILVEYSDTDCPYCKLFHGTMQKLVDEYGKTGDFAWVYRYFPIHTNAPKESEASECVADLGGNTAFWKFMAKIFEAKDFTVQPYTPMDPSKLPALAKASGVDQKEFEKCLASGKFQSKISEQYQEIVNSGATGNQVGTPFNLMFVKDGQKIFVPGAQSEQTLRNVINSIISSK